MVIVEPYIILCLKGPISLMGCGAAPLAARGVAAVTTSPAKTLQEARGAMGTRRATGTRHHNEQSFPNSDKYKSNQIRSKFYKQE